MLAAVALEAHRVRRGRWRLDGRLGNGLNLRDSAGVLGVSVPAQRGNDKTEAAVSVPSNRMGKSGRVQILRVPLQAG